MGKQYLLYGAGGHAKVILDILAENDFPVKLVIDDDKNLSRFKDIPVVHSLSDKDLPLLIGIGKNRIRKKIVQAYPDVCYFSAISKSAFISSAARIGVGSVVMQGAIIQSSSVIGEHAIINTRASIDHDCKIEDFVHIAPGVILCGDVFVGEGAFVGAGSVVLPGIRIGKWSVIGAGSVVDKDIPDGVLAVGNRCKVIKYYYEQ